MKMKSVHMILNRQRGFSLLEALLSIVIILAAGLGVIELYISSDKKNKAQTVQQIVQQAASAMSQLLSADYNATGLSTLDVVNSGLMSSNYITNDKTGIRGPYGSFDVTQIYDATTGAAGEYYVTAKKIPGDQAINICQNMFTSAAVYEGEGQPSAGSTSYAQSIGDCQDNFKGGSSTKLSMGFAFPRENFVVPTST